MKWYSMAGGFVFAFLCALGLAVDRGFYVATELWYEID